MSHKAFTANARTRKAGGQTVWKRIKDEEEFEIEWLEDQTRFGSVFSKITKHALNVSSLRPGPGNLGETPVRSLYVTKYRPADEVLRHMYASICPFHGALLCVSPSATPDRQEPKERISSLCAASGSLITASRGSIVNQTSPRPLNICGSLLWKSHRCSH